MTSLADSPTAAKRALQFLDLLDSTNSRIGQIEIIENLRRPRWSA